MSKKAVVLVSGGIDSSVLLYSLVANYECYPFTIDYGQKHHKEIVAARNICEARNHDLLLRLRMINVSQALRGLLPSALTGVGEIPEGHYAEESMKQTVVPNRNMILIAIAVGYAQGIGAEYVAYAAHSGDHYIYPDCRPEFVHAMGPAIMKATGDEVLLLSPFVDKTKADLIKLGTKFTVPFKMTWSCYKGGEKHCGRCGTCVERMEAFRLAGVSDPTEYEEVTCFDSKR